MLIYIKQIQGIKVDTVTDFIKFDGEYEKVHYDVRLSDGEVIQECWPNAGKIHSSDGTARSWLPKDGIMIKPTFNFKKLNKPRGFV